MPIRESAFRCLFSPKAYVCVTCRAQYVTWVGLSMFLIHVIIVVVFVWVELCLVFRDELMEAEPLPQELFAHLGLGMVRC
jgi:ABC-type siderophore export system fused ATPase/permease subunit